MYKFLLKGGDFLIKLNTNYDGLLEELSRLEKYFYRRGNHNKSFACVLYCLFFDTQEISIIFFIFNYLPYTHFRKNLNLFF